MKIEETIRNTANIMWEGGQLEVNIVPVNKYLTDSNYNPKTSYAKSSWQNRIIGVHDNVGVVNLHLDGCPKVPRICWDNREHHFWKGFSGGFEPRNTIINDPQIFMDGTHAVVSCYYIANFVKTSVKWVFSEPSEHGCLSVWDTFFTIENLSRKTLEDYMVFFASYHQHGKNYYWNSKNEIVECSDTFRGFSESDFEGKKSRDTEILREFRETVKGWHGIKDPTEEDAAYMHPALLSDKNDWYDQGRHILFVEPAKCLNIVSAANQARDYMLAPPAKNLAPGESFTARVRHIIAKIETVTELKKYWDEFEHDITQ
ncbi:MAG: hypothetical protein WCS96_02050 [Victivallales bacterium]|jgi:hypothetical protein